MVIRQEQFSQYLQDDEGRFIRFIMTHLQKEHTDLVDHISEETLHKMVTNGLARARRYNFTTDGDLTGFVSVMVVIAPNFDEHPAIQRVLTNETIPVAKRFDALFEPALDVAWKEAQSNYDIQAWYSNTPQIH